MSVNINTLGSLSLLLDKYVQDFTAGVQEIVMAGYRTVKEDTNFGKLLHKEELWSLYPFREDQSILYHLCRNHYGRMELTNNPCHPKSGKCIECAEEAPEEIRGIWALHNFDWIQQTGGERI